MFTEGWKPYNGILSHSDAMDPWLEESFLLSQGRTARTMGAEFIPLDIYEEGNDLVVKALVPGVGPEDLNIEVRENVLSISGETKQKKERKDKKYHVHEQRFSRYERSVKLPCPTLVDKAEAEFEDGILTLTLPKAEVTQGKKIWVQPKVKPGK